MNMQMTTNGDDDDEEWERYAICVFGKLLVLFAMFILRIYSDTNRYCTKLLSFACGRGIL